MKDLLLQLAEAIHVNCESVVMLINESVENKDIALLREARVRIHEQQELFERFQKSLTVVIAANNKSLRIISQHLAENNSFTVIEGGNNAPKKD